MNMRNIYTATRRAYRSVWANSASVDCRTLVNATAAMRTVVGRWDTCTPDRTSHHAPWRDHRTGQWVHRPLMVTNACYWFCLKTDDSGARPTVG